MVCFKQIQNEWILILSISSNFVHFVQFRPFLPVSRTFYEKVDKITTLPVGAVKKVCNTRTAVELVCGDAAAKQHTKKFLQQHQTLNKKYNVLEKQVSKHRLIIFGVPEHLDEQYITDTLTQTFVLQDGSLQILTKLKCKYEKHLNWIILVDEATALKLVHSQGTTFSHKFCRIRPYTAMPRCKNCQRIGHASSRCKFTVAVLAATHTRSRRIAGVRSV